jgi:hypothetical protein
MKFKYLKSSPALLFKGGGFSLFGKDEEHCSAREEILFQHRLQELRCM